MMYAKTTGARVAALLAGILALLTIAAAPAGGAEEAAITVAVVTEAVVTKQAVGVSPGPPPSPWQET